MAVSPKHPHCSGKCAFSDWCDWMSNPENYGLRPDLRDLPLCSVAIPGSHQSATFRLCPSLGLGNDCFCKNRTMARLLRFFRVMYPAFIYRWYQCQTKTFTQQLKLGVRYFDIRVSFRYRGMRRLSRYDNLTEKELQDLRSRFYCVHAVFGCQLTMLLEQVKAFMESHTKEVVLIDMNHFYQMDELRHKVLGNMIKEFLGPLLCHFVCSKNISNITLNSLCRDGTRVIVFYHGMGTEHVHKDCFDLWPSSTINSDASKVFTMSVDVWEAKQNQQDKYRQSNYRFYVLYAVLVPDESYILRRLCCSMGFCCRCSKPSIKRDCAEVLNPLLPTFLRKAGQNLQDRVIYAADFVHLQFPDPDNPHLSKNFVQTVIELNKPEF